jgi:hypothetical protein
LPFSAIRHPHAGPSIYTGTESSRRSLSPEAYAQYPKPLYTAVNLIISFPRNLFLLPLYSAVSAPAGSAVPLPWATGRGADYFGPLCPLIRALRRGGRIGSNPRPPRRVIKSLLSPTFFLFSLPPPFRLHSAQALQSSAASPSVASASDAPPRSPRERRCPQVLRRSQLPEPFLLFRYLSSSLICSCILNPIQTVSLIIHGALAPRFFPYKP